MIIDSAAAAKIDENQIHEFDRNCLINQAIRTRQATRDSDDDGSSPLRFADQANGVDSDDFSPTLWMTSPAVSLLPEPMSPTSRTKAIEQGRRELMEMIKDMPESFYELSLRDLVEQKMQICPLIDDRDYTEVSGEKNLPLMVDRKEKKPEKVLKKTLSKSRSVENGGYLLKTSIFRFSFRLKKKKDKKSKKVKAGPTPSSNVAVKNSEKEWWSSKSCDESSNSGGLSSSNSSDRSSSRSSSASSGPGQSKRLLRGCCSFRSED